jgi:outer membrane biosynthesis protein TonB
MAAGEPIDVRNIGRDDSLLDSLGQRRGRRFTADDPAARLLAALAADVDEVTVARRLRVGRLASLPLPAERVPARLLPAVRYRLRRAARSVVVAALAAGLLSISGMAAAVTGDALAPVKAVVSTVTRVELPITGDSSVASGDVERDLAIAEAAITRGDLAGAREMVAQAREQLPDVAAEAKPGLLVRVEQVEARIATRAEAGPVSPVVVPTPPPAVEASPVPEPPPSTTAAPGPSPTPSPTAAEPTEQPTATPSPQPPTAEPTATPTPEPKRGLRPSSSESKKRPAAADFPISAWGTGLGAG